MPLKKSIALVLVLALILNVFSFSGCSSFKNDPDKPFSVYSGTYNDPIQLTVTLSKAPKAGETADITLAAYIFKPTFNIYSHNIDNVRLWLEITWANIHGSYLEAETAVPISLDEVRVEGDFSWQGAIKVGETIELHSTVKLPREGVWAITGYFTGEGWDRPVTADMRVAVTKDAAAIIGTPDFYHSPLVYLNYIGYGQGGDYTLGLGEIKPVIMILDISKAPRPGEEVLITCNIHSYQDLSDFPVQITFNKKLNSGKYTRIPEDNLLIDGSFNWKGNIKKGLNQISATIKFPEEGDWEIYAGNNYPVQYNYTVNGQLILGYNLRLHVDNKLSYYGWKDRR